MIMRVIYQGEKDFLRMQDLIRENYMHENPKLYPAPSDLDYWRYLYDESSDGVYQAMLWEDDNKHLVAFAWMNEDAVDFVCHYEHKNLLKDILEWSENKRLKTRSVSQVHCIYLFDCDCELESIALKKGYQKSDVYNYFGKRDLMEPIPDVNLPEGYILKILTTFKEIKERAKLNALAGNEVSEDKYILFMQKATTYDRNLDFIVVAPNQEVVGFCTAW